MTTTTLTAWNEIPEVICERFPNLVSPQLAPRVRDLLLAMRPELRGVEEPNLGTFNRILDEALTFVNGQSDPAMDGIYVALTLNFLQKSDETPKLLDDEELETLQAMARVHVFGERNYSEGF